MHYSMGGLWVDFDQMTNVPGLFAAGECEYQYHGANRLGANSLLSCIYGGFQSGPNAVRYARGLETSAEALGDGAFDRELRMRQDENLKIAKMAGRENPYRIWKELGEWMTNNVTVVRYNDRLRETDEKIVELMARYQNIGMPDTGAWANQSVSFTRQLWNMLELARVITLGALNRNESRGAHYKPEFPERDDPNFLKTTKATWTARGPLLEYEDVDTQYIPPRARRYDVDKSAEQKAEGEKVAVAAGAH
jgi:succinate dehydrogenase / fumarate reductase flavoprotein subunit